MVSQKEVVLQKLAQKFTRTTSSLEDNLKKAEKEIQVLDGVIEKVFTVSCFLVYLGLIFIYIGL